MPDRPRQSKPCQAPRQGVKTRRVVHGLHRIDRTQAIMSARDSETATGEMALPPFAALRAFDVVGRVGGIRKAAGLLGIDHTVVSRHLRTLEDWMGVRLFDREGGRVALTAAGRGYHARISAALLDIAAATQDSRDQGRARDLRVWCVPGLAAQWLSDQLADFERSDPGFGVELRPTDQLADLGRFEADVDIRYYGDDWLPAPGGAGLKDLELARPPLMIVASPAVTQHWAARLRGPADLLEAPLLHEEHREQWRAWLRASGTPVAAEALEGPLLWHAHLAIAAARQGRGLALANRYLVQRNLDRGDLVELQVPGAPAVAIGSYRFVARADRWTQGPIATFRAFLRERARA